MHWGVDPRGMSTEQIMDALCKLDKDMREGRRTVPCRST